MTTPEILPSPNRDSRGGAQVDTLILHYTGMTSPEAALARLSDPEAKVSAHWFVHEDGRVVCLVPEEERAWHAGVANWAGATDINARSVGVEIQNPGHEWGYRSFPAEQVAAVIELCTAILGRHPIPAARVLAHSDVAPTRKEDPGELFPWRDLAAAGIGLWAEPCPCEGEGGQALGPDEAARLAEGLSRLGYGLGDSGTAPEAVVRAFQRHWRPALVNGRADLSTLRTLERLLELRGRT